MFGGYNSSGGRQSDVTPGEVVDFYLFDSNDSLSHILAQLLEFIFYCFHYSSRVHYNSIFIFSTITFKIV